MSHDDIDDPASVSSSKPWEDGAIGSGSTRKRKASEETESEGGSPRKKRRKPRTYPETSTRAIHPPSQALGTAERGPLSPEFAGFIYESGVRNTRVPPIGRLYPYPLEAQDGATGYAHVPRMGSNRRLGYDAGPPSPSISSASAPCVPAVPLADVRGKGKGRSHESMTSSTANASVPYPSKPDRKGKKRAVNGDAHAAVAPQPRTAIAASIPLVDSTKHQIYRRAEHFFGDRTCAGMLTALYSTKLAVLPRTRYSEILNPDPPVTVLLPGALEYLRPTTLRDHTRVLPEFFLVILIHAAENISDIPGVLCSSPDGIIEVLMTEEDVLILKTRLVNCFNTNDVRYLRGPKPTVFIPEGMRYPKNSLLSFVARANDGRFVIEISFPTSSIPLVQERTHSNILPVQESLYTTVSSSQILNTPAQRDRFPTTLLSALNYPEDSTSPSASNYGPTQPSNSHSPPNLPTFSLSPPSPLSVVSVVSVSPQKTLATLAPPSSEVGVSQLARRQSPAPQTNQTVPSSSSSHASSRALQFSQHPPETPTTGWMPSISQTLTATKATTAIQLEGYGSASGSGSGSASGSGSGSRSGLYEVELDSDEGRLLFGGGFELDGVPGAGAGGRNGGGDDFGWVLNLNWSHIGEGSIWAAPSDVAAAAVSVDGTGGVYPALADLLNSDLNSNWAADGDDAPGTLAALPERGFESESLSFATSTSPTALNDLAYGVNPVQQTEPRSGNLNEVPSATDIGVLNSPQDAAPGSSSNHLDEDDESLATANANAAAEVPEMLSELDSWLSSTTAFSVPGGDSLTQGGEDDMWIERLYPDFFNFDDMETSVSL